MNTSDIWKILGIEPTSDTAQIREAYLAELPGHNPEDDPSGFMELRAAYDAAMHEAVEGGDEEAGAEGEASAEEDEDTLAIRDVLSDFPRRVNEEEWKGLFEKAEVYGIDRQDAFSEKLLIELMAGQYLPQRIWQLFDKVFSWSARANHLKELFPTGYIEYVLNGMRYERAVRDCFFDYEKDEGEDFDAFILAYHELSETMRSGDTEKATELADTYRGSLFSHPDYRLLLARLSRIKEDFETEAEILRELDEAWPGDPFIRSAIGDTLVKDSPNEALDVYLGIMETFPEHYNARFGAAQARYAAGLFEDAKADSYELLMQDPFDGGAMNVFSAANESLVPVFEKRLEEDPSDMEARYKLSSCYYNLGNFAESLDLIADTEPDEKHRAKHYELYADLFVITSEEMTDEDKEVLLEYIEAWEGVETERQRLKFLPEKYHRLGMDDIALDKAEILLTEFPGDPELCRVKALIFRERGDERSAFGALTAGLDKSPSHASLLSIEALLFEDIGNLGAAVDSANAALASFPFNLEMWSLIVGIYDRVGQFDEVLNTIERAEEFGLPEDALAKYKAIALYETNDPDNIAQGLFEDELERNPDDQDCLEKLTVLYARGGRSNEAMDLAERLLEKHEGPFAYLLRGWLYANYPQTSDKFSKARARSDFRKALELNDRFAQAWYQLGILAYDEGRMAEAAADFQLTLDIDPGFSDVHIILASAYDITGDMGNALRVLDEGMDLAKDSEDDTNYTRLLLKKADFFFDYHMYEELAALGEAPVDAEETPENAAERLGRLAYALYQTDEDEKAEKIFQRAMKEYELNQVKELYADYLRYAKHDFSTAVKYYRSVNEDAKTAHSMINLADALKAAGENRESDKLFKSALSLSLKESKKKQGSACSDYRTGECYFHLKQYKKAKEYLNRASQSAESYEECPKRRCFEAVFTLALIALEEGDREKARELYKQVLETVNDRDYREAAHLFE